MPKQMPFGFLWARAYKRYPSLCVYVEGLASSVEFASDTLMKLSGETASTRLRLILYNYVVIFSP